MKLLVAALLAVMAVGLASATWNDYYGVYDGYGCCGSYYGGSDYGFNYGYSYDSYNYGYATQAYDYSSYNQATNYDYYNYGYSYPIVPQFVQPVIYTPPVVVNNVHYRDVSIPRPAYYTPVINAPAPVTYPQGTYSAGRDYGTFATAGTSSWNDYYGVR